MFLVLGKSCLKKLKTILQCNWLFYIIFIGSIIYCGIYNYLPHLSKYNINDNKFEILVTDINISGNYLKIAGKGKEKIQGTYFFSTLKEKNRFINEYKIGDVIELIGCLELPNNNTNFNLFNYKKYLYYEGINFNIKIESYQKKIDCNNWIYLLRNIIDKRINEIGVSSSYMKALILGEDSNMSNDIINIYQKIGISHLFAISGMHISIFTSILLFFLKKVIKSEKISYFIVILFLQIYMFLTGYSSSIVRASTVFSLLSLNKIFKLNIKTLNVFLLGISIIVIINPFIIFKIAFQFSTIISAMLIIFSELVNNTKGYFKKSFITSVISFLASFPICIYNFYQVNILSIVFNLFFIPFMSFILFPLVIITFCFPFFNNLLYFFIVIMENVARICSLIPSILIFKKPNIFIIIIYFILIFGIFNRKKLFLFIFMILVIIHCNYNYIFKNNYLIMLDVGQGDSILLHSDNKTTLIDTGGKIRYQEEEWKKRMANTITSSITLPVLKSLGLRKIDQLIISHGDYDHMGEATSLIENFKVEKVIFNCGTINDLENKLIKVLDKKKIPYYSCVKELDIGNNKLSFLNNKDYGNENDNSSVIYTEFNDHKFLFMGDAGVKVEEDLIDKYNLSDIDVLKVGHHGSKSSSSKIFINEIKPKYSIISVGKNNRYGHPNDNVLTNLEESKIYRTDQDGSIMIKIKNNKLKIEISPP